MNLLTRIYNKAFHYIVGMNRLEKQAKFYDQKIHEQNDYISNCNPKKILIIGIYLTDYSNKAIHLVNQFKRSKIHEVDQKWIAIGENAVNEELKSVTVLHLQGKTPKFKLLNQILGDIEINNYDYIIFSDDDIAIYDNFVDIYIDIIDKYKLKIAQPARTQHSYNIHKIVLQKMNAIARVTNFVEIGPIFSFHSSIFKHVLPFPSGAEMGWGLDFIWPKIAEKNKFNIGIVDLVPVDHSYRPQSKTYSNDLNMVLMKNLLENLDNNMNEKKVTIRELG